MVLKNCLKNIASVDSLKNITSVRICCIFQTPYNRVEYTILGEEGIIQYFMIDPVSGDVALKKSLMDDPDRRESYTVSGVDPKFTRNAHSIRCFGMHFGVMLIWFQIAFCAV